MSRLTVGLVTTWGTACGIAEHSRMLRAAVEGAGGGDVAVRPLPEALDPATLRGAASTDLYDLIHLNYHAALHSRWTPAVIREFRDNGIPITVTYHDTGVPNSDQCKGIVEAATATIVHEPFEDLPLHKTYYWRMGVPDWTDPYKLYGSWCDYRPILGTVGFPFPWKNYDELCRLTAAADWALLLIAPQHTAADRMRWEALNPHVAVYGFLPEAEVRSKLAGCDATAFCYTCANTGQSGAVLQGIAARKPVIALAHCRQFRALFDDPLGRTAITWCETFADVAFALRHFVRLERVSPPIVALAHQDSWASLGQKYRDLWRILVP